MDAPVANTQRHHWPKRTTLPEDYSKYTGMHWTTFTEAILHQNTPTKDQVSGSWSALQVLHWSQLPHCSSHNPCAIVWNAWFNSHGGWWLVLWMFQKIHHHVPSPKASLFYFFGRCLLPAAERLLAASTLKDTTKGILMKHLPYYTSYYIFTYIFGVLLSTLAVLFWVVHWSAASNQQI